MHITIFRQNMFCEYHCKARICFQIKKSIAERAIRENTILNYLSARRIEKETKTVNLCPLLANRKSRRAQRDYGSLRIMFDFSSLSLPSAFPSLSDTRVPADKHKCIRPFSFRRRGA